MCLAWLKLLSCGVYTSSSFQENLKLEGMVMDMAASSTTTATTATDGSDRSSNLQRVSRDEIQSALAKAAELRALHAALMQANNPTSRPCPSSASPVSHSRPLSARDYPVFAPTYGEEPLPAYYQAMSLQSRPPSGSWDAYRIKAPNNADQTALWEYKTEDTYLQSGLHSGLCGLSDSSRICPVDDHKSIVSADRSIVAIRLPNAEHITRSSRRSGLGDMNLISSCNNKVEFDKKNHEADVGVPFTDSNLSYESQPPKNRGMISLSWLFPRFKKKHQTKYKGENSNSNSNSNSPPASQIGSELGIVSVDSLKKKLTEVCARESRSTALTEVSEMRSCLSRSTALTEVSEMRSSLGALMRNLEFVEGYCEELKLALQLGGQAKDLGARNQLQSLPKGELYKPVPGEDVMIEGFLHAVSEARLSVKELCENILIQIEDTDHALADSLNSLLQPYNLSLASKHSKLLLYHLEAIVNQALYQDFENCSFQKNGSPKLLHPQQQREAQFSSYLALKDLSWDEVLGNGTRYYSPEFSDFCDRKMSFVVSLLEWTRPWPERLLRAFFVASKRVWLLHLMAWSFDLPLGIMRVEEDRCFDGNYMDDMLMERVKGRGASRVKAMVMPGFYVKERVLRCKVICKYKV